LNALNGKKLLKNANKYSSFGMHTLFLFKAIALIILFATDWFDK
jgi:hypothetical protein